MSYQNALLFCSMSNPIFIRKTSLVSLAQITFFLIFLRRPATNELIEELKEFLEKIPKGKIFFYVFWP